MSKTEKLTPETTPAMKDAALPARKRRTSQREMAKIGLIASIGVLVLTGFSKTRSSRKVHLLAGGAMVGLSVWHHMLYAPARGDIPAYEDPEGDSR